MLIGITGSFAAGKGAVVDYLVEKKGFEHFSARKFITDEIKRRGKIVNRDSMIAVGNDLRKQHGPTYIFEELIAMAKESGGDAVVESIRAVAEVPYTKERGGIVLGVDADPRTRYDRAQHRGSETDHVSFEEWKQQEERESNPDDPTKQNIFGALAISDYIIQNNGTLEELHEQIETFLEKYRN